MPTVTFIAPDGTSKICAFTEGETLLTVAQRNGLDLEGACEGAMACASCLLTIDKAWASKLPQASPEEISMLEMTPKTTRFSRLGCQIRLNTEMNGLVVGIGKA